MRSFVGESIGQYQILNPLGKGGMAVVYHARDTRLDRDVAIKLIRSEAIPEEQHQGLVARFRRETKAMAKFSHPNIVSVHGTGETEGVPYLVMDYLPGGTLKKCTGKPVNYRQAAALLLPIADALAYAHSLGVVHRDVKPANILIKDSGMPMLTDFGIAKLMEGHDTTLTGTGLAVGTPQYMAPEQWKNQITPAVDVYALGTIFYELITGVKPYDAETPAAIAIKQATEPLNRPRNYVPGVPEAVEQALFKALAFYPGQRYATMAEFCNVLRLISEDNLDEVMTKFSAFVGNTSATDLMSLDQDEENTLSLASVSGFDPGQGYQGAKSTVQIKKVLPWLLVAGVGLLAFLTVGIVLGSRYLGDSSQSAYAASVTPFGTEGNAISEDQLAPGETSIPLEGTKAQPSTPSGLDPTLEPAATAIPPTNTPKPTATQPLGIGSSFTRAADGMTMMYVPQGSFTMGSGSWDSDAKAHEQPQHEVVLDAFWMDTYEVSNDMYAKFVQSIGYQTQAERDGFSYMYNSSGRWDTFSGVNWQHPMGADTDDQGSLPVVHVNFYDAQAYCEWVGGRVPTATEAEWEKAARGADGRIYPWGNSFNASTLRYNSLQGPISVTSYPEGQSPYGIYNIAGNVFEWTADWYAGDYYGVSPVENPQGASGGEYYVLRGGSWNSPQKYVRTTHRDVSGPDYMNYLLGFRCVMDAD